VPNRDDRPTSTQDQSGSQLPSSAQTLGGDFEHLCVPWGIAVVDAAKGILFANKQARAIFEAEAGITEQGGRLRCERTSVNRSLELLMRWAESAGDREPPGGANTSGVPDRTGRTRYAVKVLPCGYNDGQCAALVVISDLFSEPDIHHASVARLFQLTRREADLAELMASGLRIDTAAELMGISVNTARIHLRNVFQKTGCASQVELARMFTRMP